MREPPRLDNGYGPSNSYSEHAGAGPTFSSSPPPVRPRSGAWKTVVLAFAGTFLAMMLLCGGAIGWLYYTFNSPTEMSSEFRELREPAGGQMNQEIIDTLNSATRQSNPDIDSVEPFVLALVEASYGTESELIDYERVLKEMQASGLSVGINSLTKMIWIAELQRSFALPEIGELYRIVDFRWLVPDVEARVTVVSTSDWSENAEVQLLYMTKASGSWKLYDHRDVLLPISEAQYFAAHSATPLATRHQYFDLSVDLQATYAEYETPTEQRAASSLRALNRGRYSKTLLPFAQNLTATYLLLYSDVKTLSELARNLDDAAFAGSRRIKGRLALLQGKPDEAFKHATGLIESVGWHPTAAMLAGRGATTAEQKQQATDWLKRSVLLFPGHSTSIDVWLDVASDNALQNLFDEFAALPDGQLRAIQLVDQLTDVSDQARTEKVLAASLGAESQFDVALHYLRFRAARDHGSETSVLEHAGKLINDPRLVEIDSALADTSDLSIRSSVLDAVVNQMVDAESIELCLAIATNRNELLQRFRDKILRGGYLLEDWSAALKLMESIPPDTPLATEDETRVAIAVCNHRLKNFESAFEQLLQLISQQADRLNSFDSVPGYAIECLDVAAHCAIELGRVLEFAEALDSPETAFVILHSCFDPVEHAAEILSLNQWYLQSPDAPKVWLDYYDAQLSYSRGDWDSADAKLIEAIAAAMTDERIAEFDFPQVLSHFIPMSESIEEWFDLRVEWALRLGRFTDLWDRATEDVEVNKVADTLRWQLNYVQDSATCLEIAERLSAETNADFKALGLEARRCYEEQIGNLAAALDLNITSAREDNSNRGYWNSSFERAIHLMIMQGDFEKLPSLVEIAQSADEKATLAALRGYQQGDAELMLTAFKQYESEYFIDRWFDRVGRVTALQRAGVWDKINSVYPTSLSSLSTDNQAVCTLGLDATASELGEALAKSVADSVSSSATQLDVSPFPNAVGAWSFQTPAGMLIAIGYDQPAVLEGTGKDMEKFCSAYRGFLCLLLLRSSEDSVPVVRLREIAADVGGQLPGATGYFDHQVGSWFTEREWPGQLRIAASHGVNRSAPMEIYLPDLSYEFAASDDYLYICNGLVVEAISVKPRSMEGESTTEGQTDGGASSDSEPVYLLQKTSTLLPCLSIGSQVIE